MQWHNYLHNTSITSGIPRLEMSQSLQEDVCEKTAKKRSFHKVHGNVCYEIIKPPANVRYQITKHWIRNFFVPECTCLLIPFFARTSWTTRTIPCHAKSLSFCRRWLLQRFLEATPDRYITMTMWRLASTWGSSALTWQTFIKCLLANSNFEMEF